MRYFKLDCCGPTPYYVPVPSELDVYDCPLCLQPHEIIYSVVFVNGRWAFKSKAAVGTEKRFPPIQQALISLYKYQMTGPEREKNLEMEVKKLKEEKEKAMWKEEEMRQVFVRGFEQLFNFLEAEPKMDPDPTQKKSRVVNLKNATYKTFWGQNDRINELTEENKKLNEELARVRRSMVRQREEMDKIDWRLAQEIKKNEAMELKRIEAKELKWNNEPKVFKESSQDVKTLEEDLARERKVKEQFVATLKSQMGKTKELRKINEEQNNEINRVKEEVNELKKELIKIAEKNSQLQSDLTKELQKNEKLDHEERQKSLELEQNKENKKDSVELNKDYKDAVCQLEELKEEKTRLEKANKEKEELLKFFLVEHRKISSAVIQMTQGIDEKKEQRMSNSEEQSAA